MKRRTWISLLLLAALLLPAGCIARKGEEAGYDVYFLSEDVGREEALEPEKRLLLPEEEPVEGLIACLLAGPQREDLRRLIPEGVSLRRWNLEEGLLTVDFSGRYGSLSGVNLTLADYSVVRTLTQLEGVEAVRITADGEALSYRDHQELTSEDAWSFQGEEALTEEAPEDEAQPGEASEEAESPGEAE